MPNGHDAANQRSADEALIKLGGDPSKEDPSFIAETNKRIAAARAKDPSGGLAGRGASLPVYPKSNAPMNYFHEDDGHGK